VPDTRPVDRLKQVLRERRLDAALIAAPERLSPVNVRYLSGFTGSSSYLIIGQDNAYIVTDFRYTEQAEAQCPGFTVVRHGRSVERTLAEILAREDWRTVGYEPEKITHDMFLHWRDAAPDVNFEPLNAAVEALRLVKRPEEVAAIRKAAAIADEALATVLPTLKGRTERECALDLEIAMLRYGAERVGFPTILVSGPRGSLPHGRPGERVMQDGDLVTIDFGACWDGYHSDETVTVAVGAVAGWQRDLFDLVRQAQLAGIARIRPGTRSSAIDAACRAVIGAAGYAAQFGHGAGHGVGLEIHEAPFLHSNPEAPDWVLEPGMTITVEPGVYLPGRGGVRLEDTLVVTETGYEYLTTWPKTWQTV
jgi:Xaa-Pro aminopeptidase